MPPTFYVYPATLSVGYALDDTGAGYNFTQLYDADFDRVRSMAVARDDADSVYVFGWSGDTFARSSDAGATWTILGTPWPSANESLQYAVCHAAGDLHIFHADADNPDTPDSGIWRSIDAGSTWTEILPGVVGGWFAVGNTRLWFADQDMTASLPDQFNIKSCNLDGTGITLHAAADFYDPASGGGVAALKLLVVDDSFCLALCSAINALINRVYKITASGVVTDISPPFPPGGYGGFAAPWDAVMFDANTYVAAGPPLDTLDVLVYRTTNAGSSWTLVQTIPEAEGFAAGSPGYPPLIQLDVAYGDSTKGYMYGYGDSSTRQYLWKTSNAGLTWTSFRNLVELTDASGNYVDTGRGGVVAAPVPRVAIPSRLATIVG